MPILRPHQDKNFKEISAHFKAKIREVLLQAPTGYGKTVVTGAMIRTASAKIDPATQKPMRCYFLVHRVELVRQTVKALRAEGLNPAICAAGLPEDPSNPIQVCMVQTLARRIHRYLPPNLCIWDECLHIASASYTAIYKAYPLSYHVGLTATPERLDGKGLGEYFKVMVTGPSTKWLIQNGWLSPFSYFAPGEPDLEGLHVKMGEYMPSEMEARFDTLKLVGDVVENYKKYAMGKLAMYFNATINHSTHVADAFNLAGIPAKHIDGDTPDYLRERAMEEYRERKILVLCNVALYGEGVDVPAIECVGLNRPTKSLTWFLQMCGRGLRTAPGKDKCIFIDHAANWEEHGLPDQPRQWSLKGRPKKKGPQPAMLKKCPQCETIVPLGTKTCPTCGFVFRQESVESASGQLRQITQADVDAKKKSKWDAMPRTDKWAISKRNENREIEEARKAGKKIPVKSSVIMEAISHHLKRGRPDRQALSEKQANYVVEMMMNYREWGGFTAWQKEKLITILGVHF